jgi:gamma-glutamylcyclotransferase (GGCT)/AIG2-like uncharacterized protein YtfP
VDLFVYGTLLDDALVQQLTGFRFPKRAAQLGGYRKCTPAGGYPYIVPDDDGTVDGALLCDVADDALRALDAYEDEGRLYRRIEVTVTIDAQPQRAFTYVAATVAPRPQGIV